MSEQISSNMLGIEPVRLGRQSGELDIYDGLRTPVSEDVILLSHEHAEGIANFARASAEEYGFRDGSKEQTYAQREVGVPSLIVRVDATIEERSIKGYEMEDSPSGLGITDRIHRAMTGTGIRDTVLDHYKSTIGVIPHVIVSGSRKHGTDDGVIFNDKYTFDQMDRPTVPAGSEPVIVKAIPGNAESHIPYLSLQGRAVAPLETEGDKSYLERTQILQSAPSDRELLYDEDGQLTSQAIKARLGSMAMGVALYLTPEDRKRFTKQGTVTAGRLRTLRDHYEQTRGGALVQPFHAPIQIENKEGRGNTILRVFVLLGREAASQVIGGCYVARPGLIIHGSSDAVSGAILYNGER